MGKRYDGLLTDLFRESELFIFDLDGTLYEDTSHFHYYAQQLKKEVETDKQHIFLQEYERMENGEHIVSIGKVYDVMRDTVLEVDSRTREVKNGWRWTGEPVPQDELRQRYPSPVCFDFETMIAIGDGWWLPNVCARHFGAKDTQTAYDRTKEYMVSADFELRPVQGLKDALHHLCVQKTSVLLTNSTADDVKRLLRILELTDCFTEIVTEARKPQYANRHFSDLIRRYDVRAAQSISIGDNYLNDIAPALEAGMQTVLINYSDQPVTGYDGPVIRSITEMIDDLKRV